MSDQMESDERAPVQSDAPTNEAGPVHLWPGDGARIAVIFLAIAALAGVSTGAWLRLRRPSSASA
jgi:hypothetical protein